ncbi:c-type cytochrome domain-containing protein [Stieleria marina]|uniref:Planctomycete cytochrome C n=1 Tax=Stieleria marina TaxID=1930275 RepID=A0A517NP17_9BACT|nr:Planctomycete cytochrome C [Planctomycetes bacterium K23_9]
MRRFIVPPRQHVFYMLVTIATGFGIGWDTGAVSGQEAVEQESGDPETAASVSEEISRTAVDGEGRVVVFNRDIAPIFRRHCLDCHGPEDSKADFRIDDVDSVSSYVEAGDLESSAMYVDYLLSEDEDMMMPPPAKGGPLSPGELALIRVWIEEGANWPDDANVAGASTVPAPVITVTQEKTLIGRAWAFQGFFHPATIHFPVALLTFGAIFVVLGWKWPAIGTQIPLACLLFGAVSAVGATMMGWAFATEKGYPGWTHFDMDNEFFWHRWGGMIVTVFSLVMAGVALLGIKRGDSSLDKVWKIGLLVAAGMVGAVGHQGGELTYGKDHYPKAFRILMGTDGEEVTVDDEPGEQVSLQRESAAPQPALVPQNV